MPIRPAFERRRHRSISSSSSLQVPRLLACRVVRASVEAAEPPHPDLQQAFADRAPLDRAAVVPAAKRVARPDGQAGAALQAWTPRVLAMRPVGASSGAGRCRRRWCRSRAGSWMAEVGRGPDALLLRAVCRGRQRRSAFRGVRHGAGAGSGGEARVREGCGRAVRGIGASGGSG